MYAIMDMGTSNTRLGLYRGAECIAQKKAPFGAKFGKTDGKEALFSALRQLIVSLLEEADVKEEQVEYLLTSGMAGSEMAICEIPHISLPADVFRLAQQTVTVSLPAITSIPFRFVPGLKQMRGEETDDVMRGEETEIAGILAALSLHREACFILPGTHNKIIRVDADGNILSFRTTFSGELLDGLIRNSILAGQVSYDFTLSPQALLRGASYTREYGVNAAIFHVRILARNGADVHTATSFLYGAVLSEDAELIRLMAKDAPIYVGGRKILREAYGILVGEDRVTLLSDRIADGAVSRGLTEIRRLLDAEAKRKDGLQAIAQHRLIAIVRKPDVNTFDRAMDALFDGGVRLAEVTFDRSGSFPKEQTAACIRRLCERYNGEMAVGAGTVTCREDVLLAYEAGASFIISPNCDPEIIRLTRKLGLIAIPAAFTPTEIAQAVACGADYVKLFPADALPANYIKAVTAPLADAKLLAVGGVNAENASDFIARGFCGIGVGSGLYNEKLIRAEKWQELTDLAKTFVNAVTNP